MPNYDLRVNGSVRRVDSSDADKPLLYVLRGLRLPATSSVGLGQCGACNVATVRRSIRMTIADAGGATTAQAGVASSRIRSGRLIETPQVHQRHDHERGRTAGQKATTG
jgi:aerobic-type carbon monoxide dehydrogenase small subunit (CoxS/CutS family)